MKKRLVIIINPAAGKGNYRSSLANILETFSMAGYLPSVLFTSVKGEAADMAREYGSDCDLMVCLGGDGTLSEVVSGLMNLDAPPYLGYIPMGTANDVASTLNLSRNPAKAAQNILSGKPIPIDVGLFGESKYFTYIAAFGAFTEVSYETPQESKQALGHLAYVLEGMARLTKLTHYRCTVEYDGGIITDDFVFGGVTNSTSVAGLVKLDGNLVELGDGLFEVILIRKPKSVLDMNNIVTELLSHNYQGQKVTVLHSKIVRFTFDYPVAWTRDGENGGLHKDIILQNQQSAINIII